MNQILSIVFFLVTGSISCQPNHLSDLPSKYKPYNQSNEFGKQGIWVFYDRIDSTLFAIQTFRNDTLHGYFERYWPSGRISEYGYYKYGLLDSVFVGYWENGVKRGEANYRNGHLHGSVIMYDKVGAIQSKEKYVYGEVDSSYVEAYESPSLGRDINHVKVDSIITEADSPWNKTVAIYYNDILVKEISYYKNRLAIENFYGNMELLRRIVYRRKPPYTKDKTFYYSSGNMVREETH